MALSALEACVTALKWILGRGVFLNGEERWFPALHGVTRRTLAGISAFRELSLMGILVAVRALLEGYGPFEIPIRVALSTLNGKMLSFQRIFCLGVVKLLVNALQRDLLPSAGRMARRAGLRETPVMWILVAIGAQVKGDASVLWFAIGSVGMALGALYLRMQPG